MGDNNTGDEDVRDTDNAEGDTDDTTTEDEADTSENTDADDAADDDAGDSDDDDAEDGDDDDSEGNSDDTSSSDTADDDTADADGDDAEDDSDEEPPMRKPKAGASNAEWAAWRKQEKAKADKSANKSGKSADNDADDEGDDGKGGKQNDVAKEVSKQLAPFLKQQQEQEINGEIQEFLGSNPDFKPFEAKVRKWAMHPSRQNVPVKSIFYEVAGDKLLALGAKRKAAADAKAKKTRTGGGQPSAGEGSKSYKDMPLDDFGKELDAVKTAPRNR